MPSGRRVPPAGAGWNWLESPPGSGALRSGCSHAAFAIRPSVDPLKTDAKCRLAGDCRAIGAAHDSAIAAPVMGHARTLGERRNRPCFATQRSLGARSSVRQRQHFDTCRLGEFAHGARRVGLRDRLTYHELFHALLAKKPNRGCCATTNNGGATTCFTTLKF